MEPTNLVPWTTIANDHRWAYPLMMLRLLEKRRTGVEDTPAMSARLDRWLIERERDGTVVDHDPADPDGFRYVPRRPDDVDLVRAPHPG